MNWYRLISSTATLVVLAFAACSSSEEISGSPSHSIMEEAVFERVDSDEPILPVTDTPPPSDRSPQIETPEVERTVPIQGGTELPVRTESPTPEHVAPSSSSPRAGTMMWSVQVGAFRSDEGALQLVEEVKRKFNQPVYKRYDPVSGLHKVTLGSYRTREEATTFKLDVQARGYPDAFIVEVAR